MRVPQELSAREQGRRHGLTFLHIIVGLFTPEGESDSADPDAWKEFLDSSNEGSFSGPEQAKNDSNLMPRDSWNNLLDMPVGHLAAPCCRCIGRDGGQ